MSFKFWYNSNYLKRPNDFIKNCFHIFDVNSKQYSNMNKIQNDPPLQIVYHDMYENRFMYEIIYQNHTSNSYMYSVYRTLDYFDVEKHFNLLNRTFKVIFKELNFSSRPNITDAKTLYNVIQLIVRNSSWTPIHFAAKLSFSNLFRSPKNRIIVMHNLNKQTQHLRRTPLMLAILTSDYETIKTILQFKPDLTIKDFLGNNLMHFAAICSNKIFMLIMRHCISNGKFSLLLKQRNNKLVTPVHFACYSKSYMNLIELLKFGINIYELEIEPPFIYYIKHEKKINNHLEKDVYQDDDQSKHGNKKIITENYNIINCENKIVTFTDEMIGDLHFENMFYGGSPLHWCKYKRSLEKLLEYEFNLNILDLIHETPLMKCIQNNRFQCLIYLLNAGADPNITNFKGNNCLHEAVIKKDISVVQALICWDVNINMKNNSNETPRHIASTSGTQEDQLIVYILHNVGAKRCGPEMTKCTNNCAFDGLTNGLKYSKWPNYEKECSNSVFFNEQIINEKLLNKNKNRKHSIRMICFDGGGIRGLISVQMLIELEKKLQKPINEYFKWISGTSIGSFICALLTLNVPLRNIKSIYYILKDKILIGPRPYNSNLLEYLLQQIIGKDVCMGNLLKKVIIMSTLADRTPVQLHLFRSFPSAFDLMKMSDDQLCKYLQKTKLNENQNQNETIKTNLKICSSNLLDAVLEVSRIINNYYLLDLQFKNLNEEESKSNNESVGEQPTNQSEINLSNNTFSDYTTFSETEDFRPKQGSLQFVHIPNYKVQKLWKACRSSGAAPTYFRASGPFIDGGIIANNPVLDTLTDFVNYQNVLKQRDQLDAIEELDLVLSIGTGKSPVIPNEVIDLGKLHSLNFLEPYQNALHALNLAQEIVLMATQTDAHVVKRAHAWCSSMHVAYFRLNPPLSENLQFNEVEEVEIINALWETKSYMHNQQTFIDLLVQMLEQPSMKPA